MGFLDLGTEGLTAYKRMVYRWAKIVAEWTNEKDFDAVVWTNLRFGFRKSFNEMPNIDQIVAHLKSLNGEKFEKAKEYVVKTPDQVQTPYRSQICERMNWN